MRNVLVVALKLQQHSDNPFIMKIGKHSLKDRYIRTCRVLPRTEQRERKKLNLAVIHFLESKIPKIASDLQKKILDVGKAGYCEWCEERSKDLG